MTLSSGRRARGATSGVFSVVRCAAHRSLWVYGVAECAQTLYYRRIRDRNCYIGEEIRQPHSIERQCQCTEEDYEWCVRP